VHLKTPKSNPTSPPTPGPKVNNNKLGDSEYKKIQPASGKNGGRGSKNTQTNSLEKGKGM